MSIKDIIEDFFNNEDNKYFILQGDITGAPQTFISPTTTNKGWDFDSNPIYSPYVKFYLVYYIISKYKTNNETIKGIFNIQIFIQTGPTYLLELGTGILTENILKFNMTEEKALLGEMSFNLKEQNFKLTRFVNSGTIFIDYGTFNQITMCEFMSTSGITLA